MSRYLFRLGVVLGAFAAALGMAGEAARLENDALRALPHLYEFHLRHGFLFHNASYVDFGENSVPYDVAQMGTETVINRVCVARLAEAWPPLQKAPEVNEDPGVPEVAALRQGEPQDALRENPVVKAKWHWLRQQMPLPAAREAYAEYLRALPTVTDAQVVGEDLAEIRVTVVGGWWEIWDLHWPQVDLQEVARIAERVTYIWQSYRTALLADSALFFWEAGEIRLSSYQVARKLPLLFEVVESDLEFGAKYDILARYGLVFGSSALPHEDCARFVREFRPDDELKARVNAIVERSAVEPLRLADVVDMD